ncbi:MAG: hypothetical protein WD696_02260 [Bryobacteraceae bacterium]
MAHDGTVEPERNTSEPTSSAAVIGSTKTEFAAPQISRYEATPNTPKTTADQPHHYTVWISCAALVVSAASALFSGLQWIDGLSERRKTPPLRVIERPRLSFDRVTEIKILATGKRWGFKPGLPPQALPRRDEYTVEITLRLKNTGRSAASVALSTYGSALAKVWHASSGSKSPVPPFEVGEAPKCSPEAHNDWKMPAMTIPINESVEISAYSSQLTKSDMQAVIAGDKQLTFCGTVSYQDGFNDTLKTVWQGFTLPGDSRTPEFVIAYVGYSP